jgi:hypothetical protein
MATVRVAETTVQSFHPECLEPFGREFGIADIIGDGLVPKVVLNGTGIYCGVS